MNSLPVRLGILFALLSACADAPPDAPQWPAGPGDPWEVGDDVPDLDLPDQTGALVGLQDFEGDVTVVFVTTGWAMCSGGSMGPDCEAFQGFVDERADQGFSWVVVLHEDVSGQPPSSEFATSWADSFGFEGPVLRDGEQLVTPGVDYPTILLLDRDQRVVERLEASDLDLVAAAVDPLL